MQVTPYNIVCKYKFYPSVKSFRDAVNTGFFNDLSQILAAEKDCRHATLPISHDQRPITNKDPSIWHSHVTFTQFHTITIIVGAYMTQR